MSNEQESGPVEYFSKYDEAAKRYKKCVNSVYPSDIFNYQYSYTKISLDNIIEKFCEGNASFVGEKNSTLFYDIVFRSDYRVIKTKYFENFYSTLCDTFVLKDFIDDIDLDFQCLTPISHVKIYLVQGCLKILQVAPFLNKGCLVLKYSKKSIWKDIAFDKIHRVEINPCAYKVMFSRSGFHMAHLNFILKLLGIKELSLSGCNLKGRNTTKLLCDLNLEYLNLTECGNSINEIIQKNISGALKNLKQLDVSGNVLLNETIKKISSLSLNTLKLSKYFGDSGKIVNSIWFAEPFRVGAEEKLMKVDIKNLLMTSCLGASLEVLDISFNSLSIQNLSIICRLQLKELNVTKSLERVAIQDIKFPSSLKILKAKSNKLVFKDFALLCKLHLEKLELDYYAAENEDFTSLDDSPIFETLKELSIELSEPSEHFISFISKFHLKYFNCEMTSLDICIDPFISDYFQNRQSLESLIIFGPGLNLTTEVLTNLRKLNLTEMSISLAESCHHFCEFLSLENLQENLISLKLTEDDVTDDDLLQLMKYRKLEYLSFSFSGNINHAYLKKVTELETLKELELTASVRGKLNLNMAQLLCVAPVKKLNIYDDYSQTISDEAFKFIMKNKSRFCANTSKLYMRAVIRKNMAFVLKHVNWESIALDQCSTVENSMQLMFDNEHLGYTLDEFISTDSEVDWGRLFESRLSKLKLSHYGFPATVFAKLRKTNCSEFLQYLFSEFVNIDCEDFFHTNLSIVDTYT